MDNKHIQSFNESDVRESFLTQDFSKEIGFFSDAKDAMIDTALMLFEDKLNEKDLQSLKKSLGRTWDNGFRYGFSKNSNFRDHTYLGRDGIVEASYYMNIVEPQELTEVSEKLNQPGVIISTDKLTEYQLEIRTRLREKFNDLQIEIGRGDRLMINGVVITGGVIINDVRNRKDYDNDIKFLSDEIKRQYLDKRKY